MRWVGYCLCLYLLLCPSLSVLWYVFELPPVVVWLAYAVAHASLVLAHGTLCYRQGQQDQHDSERAGGWLRDRRKGGDD